MGQTATDRNQTLKYHRQAGRSRIVDLWSVYGLPDWGPATAEHAGWSRAFGLNDCLLFPQLHCLQSAPTALQSPEGFKSHLQRLPSLPGTVYLSGILFPLLGMLHT